MNILPKIHDCSELLLLPSNQTKIELDNDCLDKMVAEYEPLKWLGEGGAEGMVILLTPKTVTNTDRIVAKVYFMQEDDDLQLRIACQLNDLSKFTPIFPHTYGWIVCHQIPPNWLVTMTDNQKTHPIVVQEKRQKRYLFMFMQYLDYPFKDAVLYIHSRYRVMLFLIIHGLYEARKRVGFEHGDIHEGNLMMEITRGGTTIVRYGQMEATVSTTFIPRLIDYGKAGTNRHRPTKANATNDIHFLEMTFLNRLQKDAKKHADSKEEMIAFVRFIKTEVWYNARYQFEQGGPDNLLAVLNDSYFDVPEIQRQQVKRTALEPVERCFSCGAAYPNYGIQHKKTNPKQFCDAVCYRRIHGICQYIN